MSDDELISAYVNHRAEDAFADLVRRHVALVFGTAMRQLGNRSLAEEVTQDVFLALSKKAGSLGKFPTIAGWLHQATLLQCRHRLRSELRRQRREKLIEGDLPTLEGQSSLSALLSFLDEALLNLPERERTVLILRFLEERTLREVGEALGLSEETARKRVDKSLEMLTSFFRKKGFAISALTVSSPLFTIAAQGAPPGLAATTLAAALGGAPASTVLSAYKILNVITMTAAKKITLTSVVILLLIGTGSLLFMKSDSSTGEAAKNAIPSDTLKRMLGAKEIAAALMTNARSNGGRFATSLETLQISGNEEAIDPARWEIIAPPTISEITRPGRTALVREKVPDRDGVRAYGFDGGFAETKKD